MSGSINDADNNNAQNNASQLNRIENALGRLEASNMSQTASINLIEERSDSFTKSIEIWNDIKVSFKSLNRYLVTLVLILALAVSLGFIMAMRALTQTNAAMDALGAKIQVTGPQSHGP